MTIKEVLDDMKQALESWGTDEHTKSYEDDEYELIITIRKK